MDRSRYPWKIFWLLLFGSVVGVAGLLPYLLTLFRKMLSAGSLPMPLPVLITVQIMQNIILFAGFISLGLLLVPKAGIVMLVLQRWFYGRATPCPTLELRLRLLLGV